jgi:transmembrane sensor
VNTYSADELRQLSESSEWFARLRAEPDSEDVVAEWLRWRDSDPGNALAFERIQRLWHQMDQSILAPAVKGSEARRRFLGIPARMAASVALFLCAVSAATTWYLIPGHHLDGPAPSTLAASDNHVSSLPDGSALHLAENTTVDVTFGRSERHLRMSTGEAFFKVHPDKKRPFVVRAGPIDVTAVGTAFDVKAEEGRITVAVQEGVVTVAPVRGTSTWSSDVAWRVAAGYRFQYSERDGSAVLSSIDTSAAVAWREARLEYMNTPLSQVIADVNRYASQPVEIVDPSVGRLTFTGTVFTNSVDGWLRALPNALPIELDQTSAGKYVLLPKSNP